MVVLGILVVSLFGLGLDWRLISAIEAVFPFIFLVSVLYIPESPYYSVKKGSYFSRLCNSTKLFEIPAEGR